MSLDEEYSIAIQKKQEVIENIEDIIKWTDDAGGISSQIVCINRGNKIYGMLNALMENMRGLKSIYKMPFYYELVSIMTAMLVSYGLEDEKDIKDIVNDVGYDDVEWVIELSEQIRKHWETKEKYYKEDLDKLKNKIKNEKKEESKQDLSIEQEIENAEEKNKRFRSEHSEFKKSIL